MPKKPTAASTTISPTATPIANDIHLIHRAYYCFCSNIISNHTTAELFKEVDKRDTMSV